MLSLEVAYHFTDDMPDRWVSRGAIIAWLIVPQFILAIIGVRKGGDRGGQHHQAGEQCECFFHGVYLLSCESLSQMAPPTWGVRHHIGAGSLGKAEWRHAAVKHAPAKIQCS